MTFRYPKPCIHSCDEPELLSLIDITARQNAVMNDDVDFIDRVDPKTVALLARVPTLEIV